MILCVDGNIASGKSTFCNNLCDLLTKRGYKVVLYTEPIEKWKNVGGMNLLQLFYSDTKRWAFTFQINALLNIVDIEKQALIHSLNGSIVIMERSSLSVFQIFCKYLSQHVFSSAESSIIEDFRSKYPSIFDNYKNIFYIYINTNYNTCYQRLQERSRPEEINSVDVSYLKTLQGLYEESLSKISIPKISVNGSSYNKNSIEDAKSFVGNKNIVHEIVKHIQLCGGN